MMVGCLLCRPPCTLDNTVCVEGGIRLVAFEGRVVWQWMHAGCGSSGIACGTSLLHMCFILEEEQEAEKESVQPLVV